MTHNPTLIDALLNRPTAHTPIWLMRQAGRYLPEYRNLRNQYGGFINLCKTPELAAAITLQPLKRFALDAAILFSDILVIPDAMGLTLSFTEGFGPQLTPYIDNIRILEELLSLPNPEILAKLNYVSVTITNLTTILPVDKPLIGFSGSPFTLMCYMLEGKSSNDYSCVKKWLYQQPLYCHKLLTKLSTVIIDYLEMQINAGCDCVMLFDSHGGILSHHLYQEFSLQYMTKIITAIDTFNNKRPNKQPIPRIIFTRNGSIWLDLMLQSQADAIGLDGQISIKQAKMLVGNKVALQGNIDPQLLEFGDTNTIKKAVQLLLQDYQEVNNGSLTGLVVNTAQGISKFSKIDNVAYLIDWVHELSLTV